MKNYQAEVCRYDEKLRLLYSSYHVKILMAVLLFFKRMKKLLVVGHI